MTPFLVFLMVCKVLCTDLKQCLIDKNSTADVVQRNDPKYKEVNFQVIVRKVIHPKGYVFVKSAEDAKKTIECGKKLNIHFAIQSGGHSFEKYSYGSNDSWIISLAFMNKIEFDKKSKIVTVGPGQRLGELVQYLWKVCKCSVPVGNCANVGIGGFALGGGFGLSARKHGLLSDNVVEIEIVTADTRIRRVNERRDPDLFWALRGAGGGNFGVVTEFKFRTFNASHAYIWILKSIGAEELTHVFKQWHKWLASNVSSSVTSNLLGGLNGLILWFAIDDINYTESERHLQIIKQHIPSITEKDVGRGTFLEYYNALSLDEWSVKNKSQLYYKAKSFYVSKHLSEHEIEVFLKFLRKNAFLVFVIDVYGGVINERLSNETAFVHRNTLYDIQFSIGFGLNEHSNFTAITEFGEQLRVKMNYALTDLSFMDSGESYQNYIDEDRFDWYFRYYGANGKRLNRIKWKYDRNDFFYFNQSIIPVSI